MWKQLQEFKKTPIATTWYLSLFMGWVGGESKALLVLLVAIIAGFVLHFVFPEQDNLYENFKRELTFKSVKTSAAIFSFATLAFRPIFPQYGLAVGALAAFFFVAIRDGLNKPEPVEETIAEIVKDGSKKNSKKSK
jgi:hypothetical protein